MNIPLVFSDTETTATFAKALAEQGVVLPVELHNEDAGVVIDAEKKDVFVVDQNCNQPAEQATIIASWIVTAINTCAGFKASRK